MELAAKFSFSAWEIDRAIEQVGRGVEQSGEKTARKTLCGGILHFSSLGREELFH